METGQKQILKFENYLVQFNLKMENEEQKAEENTEEIEEESTTNSAATSSSKLLLEEIDKMQNVIEGHEGQINRLKLYNGELRGQLKKSRAGRLQEDDPSDPDSPGLDNSLEIAPVPRPTNPFYIPEIVDVLLGKLDFQSLRNNSIGLPFRLVNKSFNDSWIRTSSKERTPPYLILKAESIANLYSLLKDSISPGIILQNLKCEDDPSILDNKDCKKLLEEFGWAIKSLDTSYSLNSFSILKSILSEWCPNLKELKLELFPTVTDFKRFWLKKNQLLALKRLTFNSGGFDRSRSADVHFLTTIIGAAPNLKFLQIASVSGQLTMISESFRALKYLPQITQGMQEIWLKCDQNLDFNPLKDFLSVNLSSKLTKLTLHSQEKLPKKEVSLLLNSLKDSLESLALITSSYKIELDNPGIIEYPIMPKLKVFVNQADLNAPFNIMDIHRMPNLETFGLSSNQYWMFYRPSSQLLNYRVDQLFLSCDYPIRPHLKVEKLILLGKIVHCISPPLINEAFPNLKKLCVGIGGVFQREVRVTSITQVSSVKWVDETFKGFSEMVNLRSLILDFSGFDWQVDVGMGTAFSKFKELKDLQFLTLMSGSPVPVEVGELFVNAVLSLLSSNLNLQRLTLVKFKMRLSISSPFLKALGKFTTFVEFTEDISLGDIFVPE